VGLHANTFRLTETSPTVPGNRALSSNSWRFPDKPIIHLLNSTLQAENMKNTQATAMINNKMAHMPLQFITQQRTKGSETKQKTNNSEKHGRDSRKTMSSSDEEMQRR
jgi:hypothetical protein